jgi:integrase
VIPVPRPRPPYLQRHKTRHGGFAWYVRVGAGPLIRIKSEFGTSEFTAQDESAVRGERTLAQPATGKVGSLSWLIERYRESPAWNTLSPATRRQRENIFKQIMASDGGKQPFTSVTSAGLAAARDRRGATPAQARHLLDTMRGLFKWAKGAGHVNINPAADVEYLRKPKSQGFPVWTEADLARYEAHWPIGTKERVWLAVLLYTGLRRGDAVRLGRQHVRDGIASIRTEKSQGEIEVIIPVLPDLQAALDAGPTGDLAFICGERGEPLVKESFGNMFSEAARAAGVRKSAHGVRKAGATRAANRGATVAQLEAIFGWVGGKMASLYTRSADRARLARDAMSKLGNENGTSMVLPSGKVRPSGHKP